MSFKNKNGFSLLELMIVVAVIGVLMGFGAPKIAGRARDNSLIMMKVRISKFLGNASKRAEESAVSTDLIIDCNNYKIELKDKESGNIINSLDLSKNLGYKLTGGQDYKETGLTARGTWSSTFTIYVFDRDYKKVYFKITTHNGFGFSTVRLRVPKKNFDINSYLTSDSDDWEVKEKI